MAPQAHHGLPKGATIRVRLYRPEDHRAVCRIFSAGMMGLVPAGLEEITRGDKRLQAIAVAVPAVAMVLARRCGLLTKLGVGLLSTAAVPAAIYLVVRSFFAKYVKKSLEEDLANIDGFYSTHGAGAGSAFWVAELVEPLATPAAEPGAAASASASAPAYNRTFSTGLLSSSSLAAGATASATAAPQAPSAPTAAAAGDSPAPAAQEKPAPAQPLAQAQAKQNGVEGPSGAAAAAAAASGQSELAASQAAAAAPREPEAGSHAEPAAEEAAASAAGAEDDDPEAEARRVVAGLVAAAVRRLEAAAAAAAPSSSAAAAAAAAPGAKSSGSAAASGLTSPRAGASAVKKSAAAAVPAPAPPAVQVASPAAAAPGLKPVPGPTHPAMAVAGPPAAAAAAKPLTPVMALAASASMSRTPSSAAFNGTPAAAPATRTRVVGHVALQRKTWQVAELRRMSVAPEWRGAGIGRALLGALTAHARDVGFRELVLYTSSVQEPAHRLYEKAGWTLTERVPESGIEIFTYTYDLTKKR